MKTAIVVSGGDAPGINAAIAAYARLAAQQGDLVLGAQSGFAGLLNGRLQDVDLHTVTLLAGRGGSLLRSSREPVLGKADARERLLAALSRHKIDNLLLFGGDGTIRYVMPLLDSWGVDCLALPTTIDNDVLGSDYTLGHDSACNYACQAIDGIRATAHALPGRIFMVETLGGECGNLALAIAHASGADAVLLPEYPVSMQWIADRTSARVAQKGYALVVLCEGVPGIAAITNELPRLTGSRIRYTCLGHAQRGADVSHRDRCVAQDMSRLAYDAFKRGIGTGAVVSHQGALRLHEGKLSAENKPQPNYLNFAFVNGL